MRFEKALPALRAGNKIRRKWWTKGICLKKIGGTIRYDDDDDPQRASKTPALADFDDEDVLATDWEVVV